MANKQAMVGIWNPSTGRMDHTVWNPGDSLVDPEGNPIGGFNPGGGAPVEGDILQYTGGNWERVPVGTAGQILAVVGSNPSWIDHDLPITTPADGDLIYRTGGNWVRLAIGSAADVLTVAGGLPTWAAPSGGGGGKELMATAVVGSADAGDTADDCDYLHTNGGTDGLKNAVDAIDAAGGGLIYVRKGSYDTGALIIDTNRIVIQGEGKGITFINTTAVDGTYKASLYLGVDYCGVRDCTLNLFHGPTGYTEGALNLASNYCFVENCEVIQDNVPAGSGTFVYIAGDNCRIHNSRVYRPNGSQPTVLSRYTNYVDIRNCEITKDSNGSGLEVAGCTYWYVYGTKFYTNGGSSMYLQDDGITGNGSHDMKFEKCEFSGYRGIWIRTPNVSSKIFNCKIQDSYIYSEPSSSSGKGGIYFDSNSGPIYDLTIEGNYIKFNGSTTGSQSGGVYIAQTGTSDVSRINIINNHFVTDNLTSSTSYTLYIRDAKDCIVNGNKIIQGLASASQFYGVIFFGDVSGFSFCDNQIRGTYFQIPFVVDVSGFAIHSFKICNNVIDVDNPSSNFINGITLLGDATYPIENGVIEGNVVNTSATLGHLMVLGGGANSLFNHVTVNGNALRTTGTGGAIVGIKFESTVAGTAKISACSNVVKVDPGAGAFVVETGVGASSGLVANNAFTGTITIPGGWTSVNNI